MANVDFICRADHATDAISGPGPTITLNEGLWSCCARGAADHHKWERVRTTTTLAELQMASRHMLVMTERHADPEPPAPASRRAGADAQR